MWISISEASRNWGISRTTIHKKIKAKHLSKDENGLIDPAEMSRVFGSPRTKQKSVQNNLNNQKMNSTEQRWTDNTLQQEIFILREKLAMECKLRERAEQQANELKTMLERSENRIDELLKNINELSCWIKLLETPQKAEKRRKWFWIF